jgi:hypothetical protein
MIGQNSKQWLEYLANIYRCHNGAHHKEWLMQVPYDGWQDAWQEKSSSIIEEVRPRHANKTKRMQLLFRGSSLTAGVCCGFRR